MSLVDFLARCEITRDEWSWSQQEWAAHELLALPPEARAQLIGIDLRRVYGVRRTTPLPGAPRRAVPSLSIHGLAEKAARAHVEADPANYELLTRLDFGTPWRADD